MKWPGLLAAVEGIAEFDLQPWQRQLLKHLESGERLVLVRPRRGDRRAMMQLILSVRAELGWEPFETDREYLNSDAGQTHEGSDRA